MRSDPYEMLGVDRDASPEQIHAAFRRHSKSVHPDTHPELGEEPFQDLTWAHDLLLDADRRARFDATGDTTDAADIDPGITRTVVMAFQLVVRELLATGEDAVSVDVIDMMRDKLVERGDQIGKAVASAQRARTLLERMQDRFKGPSGLLEDIRRADLARVDDIIKSAQADLETNTAALVRLDGHTYDYQRQLPQPFGENLYYLGSFHL